MQQQPVGYEEIHAVMRAVKIRVDSRTMQTDTYLTHFINNIKEQRLFCIVGPPIPNPIECITGVKNEEINNQLKYIKQREHEHT